MGQQEHIVNERDVLLAFDHPFLVKLFCTYQDADSVYFLLEPVMGGELFSVLRQQGSFNEDEARFYAASVISAFEYMHSKDIIYRDLKPENMLLDNQGFLRLTDFGFAKHIGANGHTYTLCGTPDYLAPEIILGNPHGKPVDWWTVGILLFEMLASYPPFGDPENPMQTYSYIVVGEISFPSCIRLHARSLIVKLLHTKQEKRLGTLGGAAMIKKHAWFRPMDFKQLANKMLQPPHPPLVSNTLDLSNYADAEAPESPITPFRGAGVSDQWAVDF
jgi:serine/threonine protein kinase